VDQVDREIFEHVDPVIISLFIFYDFSDMKVLDELDIDFQYFIEYFMIYPAETID